MIISVDGYDGTGKTTLAKTLAEKYGYNYVSNPLLNMIKYKKHCSYEEAQLIKNNLETKLFTKGNTQEIAKFYCETLLWLKNYENDFNIILDRGILTTYAVVGFPETKSIFEEYLNKGCFFKGSIYLKATEQERIRRIRERNPNDPDLKYPQWHKNDLEEFASSHNLNYKIIDTTNRTIEEVFEEGKTFFESIIGKNKNNLTM